MSLGTSIATGFLTSAAAGILGALLVAPREELGRFFSALNAALALALLGLAMPLRLALSGGPAGASGGAAARGASLLAALAIALAFAFITGLYLPRGRGGRGVLPGGRAGRSLLILAAAAALASAALDGWAASPGGAVSLAFGANALAGAALLGTVIVAMILGHWYLVRQRLSESHLVRFSILFAAAIALRTLLCAAGLLAFGAGTPGGLAAFLRGLAIDRGLFFWQRVGFGILGPAAFAYMILETARIRSTQSATGILYVAVIFVVIGEFLARYLTIAGAGPM